jgi:hypothetical protein
MDLIVAIYLMIGVFLVFGCAYEAITMRGWPKGMGPLFLKWAAFGCAGFLLSVI